MHTIPNNVYYRLRGEPLLQQAKANAAQAEACFQQALTVARHQQAKSWELRAATSLARLWREQGKSHAAYELLAPVYSWFNEGFTMSDLRQAQALLNSCKGTESRLTFRKVGSRPSAHPEIAKKSLPAS